MPDNQIDPIATSIVAALRDPSLKVPAAPLAALDAETAMAIQGAVLAKLGEKSGVTKVAGATGNNSLAAPIITSWVINTGETLPLDGRNFMGLEIEIAAVLGQDLTPEIAARGEAAVLAAIDHYIVGIELIGTRIDDRTKAGPFGPLSDNMITAGYVLGTQRLTECPFVDGLAVVVTIDGKQTALDTAKHPFGGVLAPIMNYAASPFDHFGALKAGAIVTTGSLTPLIEVPSTGPVSIRLGSFDPVSLTLA